MKKLLAWWYRRKMLRLSITKDEKNILLRSLELRIESLQPKLETSEDLRKWVDNPTPEFVATRALYERLYGVQPKP